MICEREQQVSLFTGSGLQQNEGQLARKWSNFALHMDYSESYHNTQQDEIQNVFM